jgi:hypothetical protein
MNSRTFLSLLPLLLASTAFAQGEVDLRTTAKKGSSVWLVQETKQEQNIDMGGQQMEAGNTVTRTIHVTIKDIDDKGNLIVETKIARVQGAVTMPMIGDSEFDSAEPAEAEEENDGMGNMAGMMTKALMAGAGKTFTAKVDPHGKVLELLDGAKEIVESGKDGAMGASGLDEAALKQIVSGAFGELPSKPVAVGGKWEHEYNAVTDIVVREVNDPDVDEDVASQWKRVEEMLSLGLGPDELTD